MHIHLKSIIEDHFKPEMAGRIMEQIEGKCIPEAIKAISSLTGLDENWLSNDLINELEDQYRIAQASQRIEALQAWIHYNKKSYSLIGLAKPDSTDWILEKNDIPLKTITLTGEQMESEDIELLDDFEELETDWGRICAWLVCTKELQIA